MKAITAVVALVILSLGVAVAAQDRKPASPALLRTTFGQLPLYFVENRGVYPEEVAYYIQGADKTLFFTKEGITFRLKGRDHGWVVKLEFVGSSPDVVARGEDQQPAVFSYFKGPEKDWKTGLRTFSQVVYRDLWPGIDLVYRAGVGVLKYEFLVAPGADPAKIRLRYRGATSATTADSGALRVETPVAVFEDALPVAWQEIEGRRVAVAMAFRLDPVLAGDHPDFGFEISEYDRTRSLVLDPALIVYCGYIGGTTNDEGYAVAVDDNGAAYIAGRTGSQQSSFPVKVGPDLTYNGDSADAFVAKIDPRGTGLLYCGYLGGAEWDWGDGVAVDQSGNAYVTGWTMSTEATFPVKTGPGIRFNGMIDAFVAKVSPSGTALVYCGFIGGADNDYGNDVAVDASGNLFVAGTTGSTEASFPVSIGPDLTHNGSWDAFVAKVDASGTVLVYCGYIGGSLLERGNGIAVDGRGHAYVTGITGSTEQSFPVKVGPDLTYNGPFSWPRDDNGDAFVAKVSTTGLALDYCGYVGGLNLDAGHGITVDAAGNAYLTGIAHSDESTFPVKLGPDVTYNGSGDAFVAKVNATGTALVYCGYIGGISLDRAYAIAVDLLEHAYVAGVTQSDETSFPAKVGPGLKFQGGGGPFSYCAFAGKVDASGMGLKYCGYIAGSGADDGQGIAVDGSGNAYMVGSTTSDERTFPVKSGPCRTHGGSWDGFAAKIALVLIEGSGTARPAGTVLLQLTASDDSRLPYQLASSLGTGPIPIDTRRIDLSPDWLLQLTVWKVWPSTFSNYTGIIDSKGQAQAAIRIPNLAALIGVRLYTAFVTLDPAAPSGIQSISNTFSFSITP